MTDLINHIKAENAKTQAWIDEDPDNRFAGLTTEDPDYWAEAGIHTVEQYERDNMLSSISDLYKDVNGFRPRHINYNEMSMAELEQTYDMLLKDLEVEVERHAEVEAVAIKEFEAQVSELISSGAGDRETAIRWLRESDEQCECDEGYFEYTHQLPYGYLKKTTVVLMAA